MIWLLALLQSAAPQPASSTAASQPIVANLELHLVCRGVGERTVREGTVAYGFGSNGNATTVVGSHYRRSNFEDQLDVDIVGSVARVRLPRRFLPHFHGGEGGWFDLKDLTVDADYITAKALVNYANHPNIRLDRRSGSVSVDGKVGSYAGQCEKVDPNAHAF